MWKCVWVEYVHVVDSVSARLKYFKLQYYGKRPCEAEHQVQWQYKLFKINTDEQKTNKSPEMCWKCSTALFYKSHIIQTCSFSLSRRWSVTERMKYLRVWRWCSLAERETRRMRNLQVDAGDLLFLTWHYKLMQQMMNTWSHCSIYWKRLLQLSRFICVWSLFSDFGRFIQSFSLKKRKKKNTRMEDFKCRCQNVTKLELNPELDEWILQNVEVACCF